MSVKESLTKKAGPLPAWAWIAVIALLIVLYAWWKGQRNQQAANAPATDTTPPAVYQFQTTPPVQEDEDQGEDEVPPHAKPHRRRNHPTDHDARHDRDDRGRRRRPREPIREAKSAAGTRAAPISGDRRIGVRYG